MILAAVLNGYQLHVLRALAVHFDQLAHLVVVGRRVDVRTPLVFLLVVLVLVLDLKQGLGLWSSYHSEHRVVDL